METLYGVIYLVKNLVNGKCYIGQTVQKLQNRWRQHVYAAQKPKYPLHLAIGKYGVSAFTLEVLAECGTLEEMNRLERYYTSIYRASVDEWGYTCWAGNGIGATSDVTKQKQALAKLGTKASVETKLLMSQTRSGANHPMFGKKHSLYSRQKMSEVRGKKYIMLSPTGEVVNILNLAKFCRENKHLNRGHMASVASGSLNSHKGWTLLKNPTSLI